MRAKDLIHLAEDIAIAVVPEVIEGNNGWMVYLINLKKNSVDNLLISSKGYGDLNNRKLRTSELRHFIPRLDSGNFVRVEPIMEDVFGLNNEYWVSFYEVGKVYDKKYLFLPESIQEKHFINIPFLNRKGVMIK